MHTHNYPNLTPLVERVLSLDPYFTAGYIFAGTALTLEGMDINVSIRLLEKGMRYRSEHWMIPFLLGFNRYYFTQDYKGAAEALTIAAKFPEAPPHVPLLAARLAAHSGEPEVGLQMIDSIVTQVQDEKLLAQYAERKKLLLVELHLKWLRGAAKFMQEKFGAYPKTIDELLKKGVMKGIPEEPFGGKYYFDEHGEPQTTSDIQRLGINPYPQLEDSEKGVATE